MSTKINDHPRPAPSPGARPLAATAVPELIANAQGLLLAREVDRQTAPDWIAHLEALPPEAVESALDREVPASWGLAEALVDRSKAAIFSTQPDAAIRFAKLATEVAERVDPTPYGEALIRDLQAQTLGALGNAYRVAGRFDLAVKTLEEVDRRLFEGTGDPLESATLLSLLASLQTDLGDYELACDLLDEAITVYRDVDDTRLLGRTLLQKGIVLVYFDPDNSFSTLSEATRHLDHNVEPHLFMMARHAQICALEASGRAAEADHLLETSRGLYRHGGSEWMTLRLAWVEAKICQSLGRLDEADAGFNVVLTEVLERKLHPETAQAALDLALCRLLQGRSREAAELAASMASMFQAWGVHRRALEAWSVVQHALATETATVTLLRDVASYLTRAWKNPDIPFAISP
jgi:tetratricopeptide (TPR) repeat protein